VAPMLNIATIEARQAGVEISHQPPATAKAEPLASPLSPDVPIPPSSTVEVHAPSGAVTHEVLTGPESTFVVTDGRIYHDDIPQPVTHPDTNTTISRGTSAGPEVAAPSTPPSPDAPASPRTAFPETNRTPDPAELHQKHVRQASPNRTNPADQLSDTEVNDVFAQMTEGLNVEANVTEVSEAIHEPDNNPFDRPDLGRDAPLGVRMVGQNLERTDRRLTTVRDKLNALYIGPDAPNATDVAKAEAEVAKVEKIQKLNAAKVDRTTAAYTALDAAVRDPIKLDELYRMGSSQDAAERATAHIAISALKSAQRAYKAEQMGASTAAKMAELKRDLKIQNTSELVDQMLRSGKSIPQTEKPRGLRFWRKAR
jgi:hypothetical protein